MVDRGGGNGAKDEKPLDQASEIQSQPLEGKLAGRAFKPATAYAKMQNGELTLVFAADGDCKSSPRGAYVGANAPARIGVYRTDMTNPPPGDHTFDSTVQFIGGTPQSPMIEVAPRSVIRISSVTVDAVEGGLFADLGTGDTVVSGQFRAKLCKVEPPAPPVDPSAKFFTEIAGLYRGGGKMTHGDLVFTRYMELTIENRPGQGQNSLRIVILDPNSDGAFWSASLTAKSGRLYEMCSSRQIEVGAYSVETGSILFSALDGQCQTKNEYVELRRKEEGLYSVKGHRIELVPGTNTRYQDHDFIGEVRHQ